MTDVRPAVWRASRVRRMLLAALAFAAGVAVGVVVPLGGCPASSPLAVHKTVLEKCRRPSEVGRTSPVGEETGDEVLPERVPPATVEVICADDSGEPDSGVTAAHRARRQKRAAAHEAKAGSRRDFLSSLDLDLFSPGQRKLHAEYVEAVQIRDAARAEIVALRERGEDGSGDGRRRLDDLRRRLAEAESVVRADAAAEQRALREAAVRARGLDETTVKELCEDLDSVDAVMGR